MTFNFDSAKACLPAIFATCFSYDKDIWILLQLILTCTFYITMLFALTAMLFALTAILELINFTAS